MKHNYIAFKTILAREIQRFFRLWAQSLLPPAITVTLYFIIFGSLIGPRIGRIEGVDYMQFIMPGLVMMTLLTNSYANVSSSFYLTKFQRNIEELLISPVPNFLILLGYVLGGVLRGLLVGIIVIFISLFFTHVSVAHWGLTIAVAFLSATMFSLAGFLNALFATKFDDIMVVPTFVLTPLTYLGGVFYSLDMLAPVWQKVSITNPILYIVNSFRYGILGVTDVPINTAFFMMIGVCVILFWINLCMLKSSPGIRP